MNGDLLVEVAKDTPWLLAIVVVVLLLLGAAERLFALSGPITSIVRWWKGRTLAKLRHEALVRAEQRRIEREQTADRVDDLMAQLADVRAEVEWLRDERADQRRRDRVRDAYDRKMSTYSHVLAGQARAAGIAVEDPPDPPDLAPLLIEEDTSPMRAVARNRPRTGAPRR